MLTAKSPGRTVMMTCGAVVKLLSLISAGLADVDHLVTAVDPDPVQAWFRGHTSVSADSGKGAPAAPAHRMGSYVHRW